MEAHVGHALLESTAALVLILGGAAAVVRAWLDRGRWAATRPATGMPEKPARRDRWAVALVALLSASAATIHLAAGPGHVALLGDIGLGFYWAAVLQAGLAIGWLAESRPVRLVWAGIVLNAVLIGAWAWSRTVGGGLLSGGPEPVGIADTVVVAFEIGVIAILASVVVDGHGRPTPRWIGLPGTSAVVAIGGVTVLATAIAMVDLGRDHHDAAPHAPHTSHVARR